MAVRIRTTANAVWTAAADWNDKPTRVTAWMETSGGNYSFLGESDALAAALEILENGDSYRIPSGFAYDWAFTPDNGALGDADAALAAMMNRAAGTLGLQFRLHSADPGANHDANELTAARNTSYARQSAAYEVVTV